MNSQSTIVGLLFLSLYGHVQVLHVSSVSYPSMSCSWSGWENDWDASGTISLQSNFLAGQNSYHSNNKEDRRYRWKYCSADGTSSIQSGSDVTLGDTRMDAEWQRGCGGNTALNYVYNWHDDDNEDRVFRFKCSALNTNLRLVSCDWTSNYVNDYDNDVNYECTNNGIIRSVESIHSNNKEDRRWKFECCRVSNSEISNELKSMDCFEDSNYVNDLDGAFDVTKSSYMFNGIYSFHNNHNEDRRFKFRYCKPQDTTSSPYGITHTLSTSAYDSEWTRSCDGYNGGNSAVIGMAASHDNGKEDRTYSIDCGDLDTSRYGLTNCGWTGDLSSYDYVNNFDCLDDGIIRGIWSKHSNTHADRLFRFECCSLVTNKFSDIIGSWQNILSCQGCSEISHEVSIGVSKENAETTTSEYRSELSTEITAGYTYNGLVSSGSVSVTISATMAQMTSNSLTTVLSESTVVTQTITCENTYLFQWIQQATDYIENVGTSTVYINSRDFLCTNNPYPSCPLGFCANDDCTTCTDAYQP